MALICHRLTPIYIYWHSEFDKPWHPGKGPQPFSALPPINLNEASPKAISGRTSYIQARLEFLRYPQVITIFFNRNVFAPPASFTSPSRCSWIGRLVSGLYSLTCRAIHTRFPCGCAPIVLNLASKHNSSDRSTKSTPSHLNVLRLLVNTGFQVLFHSPLGVLFTFPSLYYSLSVTMEYLGLEGGPPVFLQDFSCPTLLWILNLNLNFHIRDCYALWARLSIRAFC